MEGRPRSGRRFWEEEGEEHGTDRSPSSSALISPSPSHQPLNQTRQRGSHQHGHDPRRPTLNPELVQLPTETEEESSADLRKLPFSVEEASYSCPDGAAISLTLPGKARSWKGGKSDGWVLLRLHEKALLSFLRVRNRSTTEISVSISVKGSRRADFVQVKGGIGLPHENITDVKIGHLPCVYVRVDCRRKGAGGVSLHELVPVGIPAKCIGRCMGPSMENLAYKSTERLLFGPSLRTSRGPVCSAAAVARLVLPPSYLRPTPKDTRYATLYPDEHPARGFHRSSLYGGGVTTARRGVRHVRGGGGSKSGDWGEKREGSEDSILSPSSSGSWYYDGGVDGREVAVAYGGGGVHARTGGFERAGGRGGRRGVPPRRRHSDRWPSEAVFSKRSGRVVERGRRRRGVSDP